MLFMLCALAAPVRGMTISTPTYGPEWGSPAMDQSLDTLAGLGVNWVSYHPYARVRRDGSIDGNVTQAWIRHPVDAAHERGLKIMVKPHLAYWGSGFSWRGDITFDDPEAEARFFREYTAWVVALAKVTADADAFAVGTELKGTLKNEAAWRNVVKEVREVHRGSLTYAANWDAVGQVGFWDALDAIGVQAYYPIVKEGPATSSSIAAGWDRVFRELQEIAAPHHKPVVFTELGYDASSRALAEPWASGSGSPELQQQALDGALSAIEREPLVVGAFLWKWFPGEVQRGDFRMSEPRLQRLIKERWHPEGSTSRPR